MGRTAALTTGVVAAAAVGGYFYLSNSMENEVRAQVDAMINAPDIKAKISYDSLKTSLLSGTATIEGISITNEDKPDSRADAERVDLTIGFDPFSGTATLDGLRVDGANFNAPGGKASFASAELQGADLPGILERIQDESLNDWPFTLVDIQGLAVSSEPAVEGAPKLNMSLNAARVETNDDGSRVEEFLIDALAMTATNQTSLAIDHYQVKGLEIGWIMDLVALSRAEKTEEGADEALRKAAAASLAKASINYMGMDSFILQGLSFGLPQGAGLSVKEISVKDLVRPADFVLGGTMKVDAFELKGLQNTSPQAMQILTLAELDTIRMDLASTTQFDGASGTATTETSLQLDKLLSLRSQGSVSGLKAEQISDSLIDYQTKQMEQAFQAAGSGIPPQQDPMAQFLETLSVYTGYYDGISLSLALEDQGLLSRGLKVYSALSGMPEDQLRQQFTMMTIAQAGPVLGQGAPDNLAEVIQAFMAPQSQPMRISLQSLVPITEDAISGITPQTWQDVFGLEMETVAPSGTPASK